MDINYFGENYIIINNHFKFCVDGIIDFDDNSDEEYRRYLAINFIKEYIDNNFPEKNVIVLGDLNDDIAEDLPNNIFQNILNDSINYRFADLEIAQGNSSDVNYAQVQTIQIDQYIDGGWSEYDQNISDHRPVAIKISSDYVMSHDVNEDGVINNSDFSTLLDFVVNGIDLV